MATYETILSGRRGEVMGPGWGREEIVLTAIVAMTTAMIDNANDDVGLFYVPAGFVVTGILAKATDLDTATSPAVVIDIGDADDEDRLLAASTIGQAATASQTLAAAGVLYKYTTKTQIRAYVATAATTAAAGTLYVALKGFVDPDFNTTGLTAST